MSGLKFIAAADAVLNNLLDRGGIDNALSEVKFGDQETWQEIRETLATLIEEAVAP